MPHITVKMFPGRTAGQKEQLASALRKCTADVLGCEPGHVSVALTDVEPKDWHLVYDSEIKDNPDLFLAPSYTPGDELKTIKKYAITGFGCAGYNCAKALRQTDPDCQIHVYERTMDPPSNPMLTTYYASGKLEHSGAYPFGDLETIQKELDLTLHTNETVLKVLPESRSLLLKNESEEYTTGAFDKILISTGARAILPNLSGLPDKRVFLMRTMEDAESLKQYLLKNPVKKAVVVGASMVGIKVAELLWKQNIHTTIADFASWLFPLAAFEPVAREIERRVAEKGIDFKWNAGIEAITEKGARFSDQKELEADLICMCIGTRANVELAANTEVAEGSSIKIGRGIIVNEQMETSVPGIYAAGDCCEGRDLQTGNTMIIGLWANAGYQGENAGFNMAGRPSSYYGNIVHNITHFMDMDFIGLGNNKLEGETITFGSLDSPLYIQAVKGRHGLSCINILGNCHISGILKSFLLKQLSSREEAHFSQMQRTLLLLNGLTEEFIDLLEGGIV